MVIFILEVSVLYVELCTTKCVITLMFVIFIAILDNLHLWYWRGYYFQYISCIEKIGSIKIKMRKG